MAALGSICFLHERLEYEMESCDLGDILRAMRLEKRLTLQQLSDLTNYSTSYISQIERGQANPSIGTLHTITQALGETFASLFRAERNSASLNASPSLPNNQADLHLPRPSRFVEVVRKNQRKGLILPGNTFEQQLLGPDLNRKIEFLWTYGPISPLGPKVESINTTVRSEASSSKEPSSFESGQTHIS